MERCLAPVTLLHTRYYTQKRDLSILGGGGGGGVTIVTAQTMLFIDQGRKPLTEFLDSSTFRLLEFPWR